jgi:hypothetical protein
MPSLLFLVTSNIYCTSKGWNIKGKEILGVSPKNKTEGFLRKIKRRFTNWINTNPIFGLFEEERNKTA